MDDNYIDELFKDLERNDYYRDETTIPEVKRLAWLGYIAAKAVHGLYATNNAGACELAVLTIQREVIVQQIEVGDDG